MECLHHPLREPHSVELIGEGLGLIQDIQRTGDIFFPKRWADAMLRGHSSPLAATIVRDLLAKTSGLAERLRWVVLSSADELLRAAR
jgi:aminopeptidase N